MKKEPKRTFKYLIIFITTLVVVIGAIVTLFLVKIPMTYKLSGVFLLILIELAIILGIRPKMEIEAMEHSFKKLESSPSGIIKVPLDTHSNDWLNSMIKNGYQQHHRSAATITYYRFSHERQLSFFKQKTLEVVNIILDANTSFSDVVVNQAIGRLEDDFMKKEKFKSYSIINFKFVLEISDSFKKDADQIIFLKRGRNHLTQTNVLLNSDKKQAYFLENKSYYPNFFYKAIVTEVRTLLGILEDK